MSVDYEVFHVAGIAGITGVVTAVPIDRISINTLYKKMVRCPVFGPLRLHPTFFAKEGPNA